MNPHTGSVDTRENWLADCESMEIYQWHGYESMDEFKNGVGCIEWDNDLIEVVKDENGDWVEM